MQEVAVYDLSREKIDLIKQTVAKGSTDLELDLFLHACKRTGLDPLMKQIYAIKRWNAKSGKEEMAIQTGIDGYRLIADRTGQYAGSDEATYMLGEDGFPDVASVTVYKLVGSLRCAFSSSARWKEYCQMSKDGKPTTMWTKMPFLMLAKCAEALALRKAFPAELSGVYTHEEMMQADTAPEPGKTSDQKFTAISNKPLLKPSEILAREEAKELAGDMSARTDAEQAVLDAPAPLPDDPAEPYRAKIRTAHSLKEVNERFKAVPEELKQDVWPVYNDTLKRFSKA